VNPSIRQRLLLILITSLVVAWTATAFRNYQENRDEINELFDAQLAQAARALLSLSSHELHEQLAYDAQTGDAPTIPEPAMPRSHKYEQKLAYQIWAGENRLAAHSSGAPTHPMAEAYSVFQDRDFGGARWRVYALADTANQVSVHVAERYEQRDSLSNSVALRSLGTLAISLPLLALLIWFGVGRAMGPLYRIARAVGRRQLTNLEPIPLRGVPTEATPLVEALNDLFKRLRGALENVYSFTSNAAHELRTPLAALKTHAQVAARTTDDAMRREALAQVIIGADRATYLVDQLLTLARLDPEAVSLNDETTNLQAVAEEVLAELAPDALAKDIELSLSARCRGMVPGKQGMLSILVRNLVENAIRYSPRAGRVAVSLFQDGDDIVLRVADSGPGIPKEEREKIFKRFYRCLGTGTSGSGLGLSIVQRIAEIHDAQISLDESIYRGLQFDVRLHAAPGADQEIRRFKAAV
jgi:two-component system sensor histidine kinase QseC